MKEADRIDKMPTNDLPQGHAQCLYSHAVDNKQLIIGGGVNKVFILMV